MASASFVDIFIFAWSSPNFWRKSSTFLPPAAMAAPPKIAPMPLTVAPTFDQPARMFRVTRSLVRPTWATLLSMLRKPRATRRSPREVISIWATGIYLAPSASSG